MVDRWESPEYLVFSSVGDRCTGFLVDCPDFSGYSPVRVIRKHGLDWLPTLVVMWLNMPNICIQSMQEGF